MFTGIIESTGIIEKMETSGTNQQFWISCSFLDELKLDQSIAHDGACLTVDHLDDDRYRVTAIKETLDKTSIGSWQVGKEVNLERCMKLGDRLDGHMVQGHVDTTARCVSRTDEEGSWRFRFEYDASKGMTVEKGSITVNGISLTVVDSAPGAFSVAIIPYTLELTNLKSIQPGDSVNLEFDLLGKYIQELMTQRNA